MTQTNEVDRSPIVRLSTGFRGVYAVFVDELDQLAADMRPQFAPDDNANQDLLDLIWTDQVEPSRIVESARDALGSAFDERVGYVRSLRAALESCTELIAPFMERSPDHCYDALVAWIGTSSDPFAVWAENYWGEIE